MPTPQVSSNDRTVVCFLGTLRALNLTRDNLIEKVIEPLHADVMICFNRLTSSDEDSLKYFDGLNVVDVCIHEEGKNGYEELLDEYSRRLNVESRWREYLDIEGNWLGGIQGLKGTGIIGQINPWKLLERIQYVQSRGGNYRRFVITRSDFFWLTEHPPLRLLDPRYLWIPTGQDYGGYSERHGVCSEKNIRQYLSTLEYMIDYRAMRYLAEVKNSNPRRSLNGETQFKHHLDYCGVRVGRFKSVAYLTGDSSTPTSWSKVKTLPVAGKVYSFKYGTELKEALRNSEDFQKNEDWNQMILKPSLLHEFLRLTNARIRYRTPTLYRLLARLRLKLGAVSSHP